MQVGDKVKATVVGFLNYAYAVAFYQDNVRYRAVLKHKHCAFNPLVSVLEKGTVLDCVIHKIKSSEIQLDNRNHELEKENFNKIEIGSLFVGTVINRANFGLFIQNEDGIKGMVHMNHLSYHKRVSPGDYQLGDTISALVIDKSLEDGKVRVSLSTKALEKDPWDDSVLNAVGKTLNGVVHNVQDFGAFICITDLNDIDGLLHVSKYPENFVPKRGMELEVMVQSVNLEQQRISLVLPDDSTEE